MLWVCGVLFMMWIPIIRLYLCNPLLIFRFDLTEIQLNNLLFSLLQFVVFSSTFFFLIVVFFGWMCEEFWYVPVFRALIEILYVSIIKTKKCRVTVHFDVKKCQQHSHEWNQINTKKKTTREIKNNWLLIHRVWCMHIICGIHDNTIITFGSINK